MVVLFTSREFPRGTEVIYGHWPRWLTIGVNEILILFIGDRPLFSLLLECLPLSP